MGRRPIGRRMMAAARRGLVILGLTALCLPVAAARATVPPSYYLALGDSVPVWTGTTSYPYLLLAHYRPRLAAMHLENLAVSGESTTTMLDEGQYARARAFLRAHRGHIALITIDIGGNDIVGCAFSPATDLPGSSCSRQALTTIRQNLPRILTGLRHAAPGVPIIGMTYYDPVLGAWPGGATGQTFADDSLQLLVVLNRELSELYGGPARTADVQGAFDSLDQRLVPSPWGTVPVDVERACQWLDISCQAGESSIGGDDPVAPGERVIASAFEARIHGLCVSAAAGLLRPCPSPTARR